MEPAVSIREARPNIYVPVIVYGEYMAGILRSARVEQNQRLFDDLMSDCTILEADEDTAKYYGQIVSILRTKGKPIPTNDVWIAAIARQHDLPLMTRDRHFEHVDNLEIITW